jgi:histidine kinase
VDIATTTRLARSPSSQPFAFVWNAWRQMTGAQVRHAAAFWLGWGLTFGLAMLASHPSYAAWEPIATGFYDTFLITLVLLLGVAVADACPPSQAPLWRPYAIAAVVADAVGTPLYVLTEPMIGLQCCWEGPRPNDWAFIVAGLGTNLVICILATFGYFHRQRALRRMAVLRGAQLERERLARRAFEARLQAMQARVEPRFLFNTLAQVESLYETDATQADRMLDDLIVYLRAALPQLRETTSTVSREIELVRAYYNIANARLGDRLLLNVALLDDGHDVRFPPMVLLPLIEHAILERLEPPRARGPISIDACVADGKLRLTVADPGARSLHATNGNTPIGGIRERLAALYGTRATLSFDANGGRGIRAVITIPYERVDDRDHR